MLENKINIELEMEELRILYETPSLYLRNYFNDLKSKIDITFAPRHLNETNQIKRDELAKFWHTIIDKVNKYEVECLKTNLNRETKTKEIQYIFDKQQTNESIEDLIEHEKFKLKKVLFLNRTVFFLDKSICVNETLFDDENTIKLVTITDEYISDKEIEDFKRSKNGYQIADKLTSEKIKLKELSNKIREKKHLQRQIIEISLELNKLFKYNSNNYSLVTIDIVRSLEDHLTSIESNAFQGLVGLNILDLSDNRITLLHPNTFQDLVNLKTLNLSSNEISAVDSAILSGLEGLKILDLSNNKIEFINGEMFSKLGSLECLLLFKNLITSVSASTFMGLNKLKWLKISSNQINTIDSVAFQNLTNLELLDLSHNQLTSLDCGFLNYLNSLKELNLASNQLNAINASHLRGLTNLVELDLEHNAVVSLNPLTFNELTKLKKISLFGNPITFALSNRVRRIQFAYKFKRANPSCCIYISKSMNQIELKLQVNFLSTLVNKYFKSKSIFL